MRACVCVCAREYRTKNTNAGKNENDKSCGGGDAWVDRGGGRVVYFQRASIGAAETRRVFQVVITVYERYRRRLPRDSRDCRVDRHRRRVVLMARSTDGRRSGARGDVAKT